VPRGATLGVSRAWLAAVDEVARLQALESGKHDPAVRAEIARRDIGIQAAALRARPATMTNGWLRGGCLRRSAHSRIQDINPRARWARQVLPTEPGILRPAQIHCEPTLLGVSMSLRIALSAGIAVIVLLSGCAQAQQVTVADCERDFKPQSGQAGKDVIWVPTPDGVVNRMLTMAKTTPKDYVIDLGAGDGKIAIAAARDFGARALGIEYNPDMVKLANCMARAAGVADKAQIKHGDIFKEDFSQADVLTMYLLPSLNLCVRHRVLAMKPGTRVTSHSFTMGEWDADQTADASGRTAFLWIVPARVGGTWNFRTENGSLQFEARFDQTFQKIKGEATVGGGKHPLTDARLDGEQLRFALVDGKGGAHTVTGTVRGREFMGTAVPASGSQARVTGTLAGNPESGRWAAMADDCARYYQ
jgi:hypothetical protein